MPDMKWKDSWNMEHPELRDKYVVTLPARLTRWKGQEDFIAIIAVLRQQGIPAHGLLVGGAHPRKQRYELELRRRIENQGLSENITLLGHRSDLREIMAVSSVILSLSQEPEAFGRVSLEALSLGRPVVAYDHGGVGEQLSEILPEGRVPVGDLDMCVKRLMAWYVAPPQVPTLHSFTLEHMLEATLEVYNEATQAAR